ncbi:hypothetical protein LMJF_25_0900 [Leishmania major strain Friedlin]|uniref:Uncharacterized protein n=1 Tax=Leishmania major TaxID=5664 RepID=Q4QA04_LEIMA|nr:hypothetical protein LMJF_25_0900 [Leishmania major strain Friedlin]CAG9575103.1 hypothetical_protein_-_conserved [Leishmania major strain Friedlin]CAJ05014.1 hypothetical protein LMJF_25_0900 [Leishmania major strain Friedlin]|eukprot:XP_001683844.1 hypothetical protein LMJF_25_0900 [Leishmania major strain Friedlin]
MTGSKALCRACLTVYSAFMVILTAVYLWSKWGVHRRFVEVLEETKRHSDSSADVNGVALVESGGAEYVLVALLHVTHLICFTLFLFGYKSGVKMALGCALLLASAVMYILVYGCVTLQGRLEQQAFFASPTAAAAHTRKQKESQPYQVEVNHTPGAIAVAGAAASARNGKRRELSRAAAEKVSGKPGTCGIASARAGEPLSYAELGWMLLEALVDVLAIIAVGPESPTGDGGVRLHPDGTPISSEAPLTGVRRLSLLMLNFAGFALSMWGVMLFDASPTSAPAPALSTSAAASGSIRGRGGRSNGAQAAARWASAPATLADPAAGAGQPSAAPVEAKKYQ